MLPVLAPLLASLAQAGLGLIGNAVLAKGKEVVEEKLGVDLEDAVQTDAGRAKLLELQFKNEDSLRAFAIAKGEQDLKAEAMAYADTANSRDANARIQESANASWLAKNAGYIMDFGIVGATLFLITLLLFKGVPPENKEIAFAMLGSLLTLCGTVVNWHRGTSSSSARHADNAQTLAAKLGAKQ